MEDYEIYLETIDEEGAYILINNNDTFFCYESLKQNALTFIQNIDKLKALIDRKDWIFSNSFILSPLVSAGATADIESDPTAAQAGSFLYSSATQSTVDILRYLYCSSRKGNDILRCLYWKKS